VRHNPKLIAFIGTTDLRRAREFYRRTLGFELISQDEFAAMFHAGDTILRITPVDRLEPAGHTVLGWQVDILEDVVDDLVGQGVEFQRYPYLEQDGRGICTSPEGVRVAWFKDPDGNTLSVSQPD